MTEGRKNRRPSRLPIQESPVQPMADIWKQRSGGKRTKTTSYWKRLTERWHARLGRKERD